MSVKEINIKNCTYYFFNNIISINGFDPNNFRIDGKSCKNILFYVIAYVTNKKDLSIYHVGPKYLIFNKVNECFKEISIQHSFLQIKAKKK